MPALAQYPGRIDTGQTANTMHLRATAVLEYTGDLAHIKESRLLPIAVWDGVQYQPGGLYLAQPAPLAVEDGTQYELMKDGHSEGFFNIKTAEQVDGLWLGVGVFQKPAPLLAKLHPGQVSHVYQMKDVDPDKPHFAHVPPADDSQSSAAAAQSSSAKNGPTLHQRSGSGATSADNGRPALHSDADAQRAARPAIDPDRPVMEYSNPDTVNQAPHALMGFPPGMKQIAAVSDADATSTQSFAFVWANPLDEGKMKLALEKAAQDALAPPLPAPAPAKKTSASRRAHRKASAPPPPPPAPMLQDEQFRVFGLTMGGGATMVFSAHTASDPAKYVTIIAQPDFYGNAQVLLKHIAAGDNLDVTPRMKLVDAVDTEGNDRGNLLFELRGHTYRRFAIYRVAGGQAAQVFLTPPLAMQ